MNRIIIICEGQTEQEFCNTLLQPHFSANGITLQAPLIKKTMGGIANWTVLKPICAEKKTFWLLH